MSKRKRKSKGQPGRSAAALKAWSAAQGAPGPTRDGPRPEPRERALDCIPDAGFPPRLELGDLEADLIREFCSAGMLDSEITHGSGVMALARKLAMPLIGSERRAEVKRARALDTAREIFDALLAGPDTLVQDVLQERAQTCEAQFADLLLPALPTARNEALYEFAVLFFARAKGDYAARVYAAAVATTDAYGLSLLCLLLGRIDRAELALPFVWNAYHHLAAALGPPLDQGALRGLIRYAERRQSSQAQVGAGGAQA